MSELTEIMKKLADDPNLMERLKATKTPEDIVALAKSEGFNIDLDDVKKALAQGHVDLSMLKHLM